MSVSKKGIFAWCLYDWANSTFPGVILTFVFSAYYSQAVAPSVEQGTASWGFATSIAAAIVAILSPFLGSIADQGGRRKPWIFGFTLLCAVAAAGLWIAVPKSEEIILVLALVVVATIGFELATVFYNAMLPDIAPPDYIGRISGWAWGIGYVGMLICLIFTLFAFVQTETPLFGLNKETAEHIRITGPLVAVWFLVFSIPMFLMTPDRPSTGKSIGESIRSGIGELIDTLRNVRQHSNIAKFLLARMIYNDGLTTVFAFGGIYAAGTFGMTLAEVIQFGIAINVTAGIGAIAFAWIDDWLGAKRTLIISLIALTVIGLGTVLVETKAGFWSLGLLIGLFFGPAQAASRSMLARLAPEELRTQMFGLYALSGKATAFIGPALFGWATITFGTQRAGMGTVLVFFFVGLLLLLLVKESRATR
ncbi:MAG: MFS transporter [Pseudomonadota bacterium]